MSARVLFGRRAVAASAVLGGMALTPRTIYAEAPENRHVKKPIYDDEFELPATQSSPVTTPVPVSPSSTTVVSFNNDEKTEAPRSRGPTPTDKLAVHIGSARLFLFQYALAAENAVNRTMDRAFDLEQSFTTTIASLAPPRESGEKLMPGSIYVLVAAMAGSIVTRRSNILLRTIVPPTFGVGAAWTVLPITMGNVSDLAWKYEQRFPVVADSHLRLRESIEKTVSFARVHSDMGVRYVDEKITDVRETMEDWVKKGK